MMKRLSTLLYASLILIALIFPLISSVAAPVARSSEDATCSACYDAQPDGSCQPRTECGMGKAPSPANSCQCACVGSCFPPLIQDPTWCDCRCPNLCAAPKVNSSSTCACECPTTTCPAGQTLDPATCSCGCLNTCPSGQSPNPANSCACTCNAACPVAGMIQDANTCACTCLAVTCPAGQVQDPTTCVCGCPKTSCPAGQARDPDNGCQCSCTEECVAPRTVQDSTTCACTCPAVTCIGGQIQDPASCGCVCPITKPHLVNGSCKECRGGEYLDGAVCRTIPTPTPTATQTPTPTATPACQAYELDIRYEGDWGRAAGGYWHLSEQGRTLRNCLGSLALPSDNRLEQFLASAGTFGDDYATYTIYGSVYGQDLSQYRCTRILGATNAWFVCLTGQVYFDQTCRRIPPQRVPANTCDAGYVLWRGSPISLNFSPSTSGASLVEEMTFTQFPLMPGAINHWSTWKASSEHPLLVIDPTHSGKIESAYQLFGNWAFGGQGYTLKTMLKNSNLPPTATKPWKEGFTALATLDSNNDEQISGTELAPLALWFDENRNGISEAGEVKAATAAGIKALYYKGSKYNDELDGFELKVAYKRDLNGSTKTGSAVDWFSPGDPNKDNVIKFEMFRKARKEQRQTGAISKDDIIPTGRVNHASPINGEWEWSSDQAQNPKEPAIGGILKFLAFQNGEVLGQTISESHYKQPYPANSVVNFQTFKGLVDKKGTINFSLKSDEWSLKTSAKLSSDKATLIGKTTATQTEGSRSFSYTWTAKKSK